MHTQSKKPLVRKPSKKVADAKRIRFGSGSAPAKLVQAAEETTADSRAVRFGSGSAPASLKR